MGSILLKGVTWGRSPISYSQNRKKCSWSLFLRRVEAATRVAAIGSPADAPANSSREREAVVALPKRAVPEEHKKNGMTNKALTRQRQRAPYTNKSMGSFCSPRKGNKLGPITQLTPNNTAKMLYIYKTSPYMQYAVHTRALNWNYHSHHNTTNDNKNTRALNWNDQKAKTRQTTTKCQSTKWNDQKKP